MTVTESVARRVRWPARVRWRWPNSSTKFPRDCRSHSNGRTSPSGSPRTPRCAYVQYRSSVEPMLAALADTGGRLGDRLHFLECTVGAQAEQANEALTAAATATDGFVLGGSGYRSPEVIAWLRIASGCSDVYDSPASSCRIPTARQGSSEHEKGLAVDFTWQGQTICYPRPSARRSNNAACDGLRAKATRGGVSQSALGGVALIHHRSVTL